MHSAATNLKIKGCLTTSDAWLIFVSMKLATATTRGSNTAILSAQLLIAAIPVQGQTEAVLYNFTGGSDGAYPGSNLTSDGAGNFYGTTYLGGLGYGTVFELSPNDNGGWKETVLYSFTGGVDGEYPIHSNVIFDNKGNLYGTTFGGGGSHGVVFELSPTGKSWTETVIYIFGSENNFSANPVSGLIIDSAGNLYGTTIEGGDGGPGTVFELSQSGGVWTEQVIYSVDNYPANSGLTMDTAGNIFGTSTKTVFELSLNGSGGWNPTVIHTFPGTLGTAYGTPVLDKAGNIYGTTYSGGAKNDGTVYRLSPSITGKWTLKILHAFAGQNADGSNPFAGIVFDKAGNIYGTTTSGGQSGVGTVFELAAPARSGQAYKEKVLWNFNGTDGRHPYGSLILDSAGNLYSTTWEGGPGASGFGVVFKVTP